MNSPKMKSCAIIGGGYELNDETRDKLTSLLRELVFVHGIKQFLFGKVTEFVRYCFYILKIIKMNEEADIYFVCVGCSAGGETLDDFNGDLYFDKTLFVRGAFFQPWHEGNYLQRDLYMIDHSDFLLSYFDEDEEYFKWHYGYPLFYAKFTRKTVIDFNQILQKKATD